MKAALWMCVATILVVVHHVYSYQENDTEIMQNDPDSSFHLESMRMTRGRGAGYDTDIEDDRTLLREERKRVKAERRRLKEERRARRRQQKQAGQRNHLDEDLEDHDLEGDERDFVSHRPQHHQVTRGGISIPFPSSSGVSGSSGGLDAASQLSHLGDSSSGQSGSTDHLGVTPPPAVIDLEWMRANLSSLWSVVRTLSRQQGRSFLQRGGRGRHHHSGVVNPPNTESCPGGDEACRSEAGEICGAQGSCSCGHCFCNAGYYGTFCQCDDHSCPVYDGMTCGGPSRGQCRCGGCVCRPGYTGDSCNCPTDTQTCTSSDSDEICSGKGTCECGRCQCSDGHKGMYCEDTVYAAGVCEKLKSCVMCRAWNRDLPSCAHCQITVTTVESLEPSMTTCVMVNSGCLLQFSYIPQTADAYTVLVPRDMVCPT